MSRYCLTHLPDQDLVHELKSLVSRERQTTALLIAHLAEVDARRLYAPAGYPSMFEYCVGELRFSDQSAFKRIRVARLAQQFPAIYGMLADGRLHVSGVVMISAHLTPENADDLLAAAARQTRAGIEQLLAGRFPRPDLPTLVEPVAPPEDVPQLSPGRVGTPEPESPGPGGPGPSAPAGCFPPLVMAAREVRPLAPQRYAIQCTVGQGTYEKLQYAKALLGHSVPAGDLDEVLERALDALIARLERQKFAGTDRPRPCRPSDGPRHVPADVKRAVWERDGGRCAFVGENGHRCESRTRLEFDHVEPVASGGRATVQGLRLRCQAHNHHEAELRFGRDFMRTKRVTGRGSQLPEHAAEVIPWLRQLGMRADESRRLAACCVGMAEASLEERVRHALWCSARSSPRRVA
jgi:hypothetical protein